MQNDYVFQSHTPGIRLDKFITDNIPDISRSRIKNIIESGHVKKNGIEITDCSYKTKNGDEITVNIPEAEPTDMRPAEIPLDIIYEDEHFLVINKQAGLTVHPGAGNHGDTMANALLAHCGESLSGIGGVERPGIVHRLDKDTTGLILVAKNDKAHHSLSEQIAERSLKRTYTAICWGVPKPLSGTVKANIGRSPNNRKKMAVVKSGGKEAVTHYEVKEILGNGLASVVECRLQTGRTHQIRVHMTHIKHPLVGDQTYGSGKRKAIREITEENQQIINDFNRQALHSSRVELEHPVSGEHMEYSAPLPDDMKLLIEALK